MGSGPIKYLIIEVSLLSRVTQWVTYITTVIGIEVIPRLSHQMLPKRVFGQAKKRNDCTYYSVVEQRNCTFILLIRMSWTMGCLHPTVHSQTDLVSFRNLLKS